jgi:hypothetical protein
MFLPPPAQSGDVDNAVARHGAGAVKERRRTKEIPQSTCYLTSVLALRDNVKKAKHMGVWRVSLSFRYYD